MRALRLRTTQRRRTSVDELNMRTLFEENDLVSVRRVRAPGTRPPRLVAAADLVITALQAEVQSFFSDGGVALHTRSAKYGRLSRGQLVCVPPVLIKRLKQHFSTLAGHSVDVVLGCNGWVWVQARHQRARCLRMPFKPAAPSVRVQEARARQPDASGAAEYADADAAAVAAAAAAARPEDAPDAWDAEAEAGPVCACLRMIRLPSDKV